MCISRAVRVGQLALRPHWEHATHQWCQCRPAQQSPARPRRRCPACSLVKQRTCMGLAPNLLCCKPPGGALPADICPTGLGTCPSPALRCAELWWLGLILLPWGMFSLRQSLRLPTNCLTAQKITRRTQLIDEDLQCGSVGMTSPGCPEKLKAQQEMWSLKRAMVGDFSLHNASQCTRYPKRAARRQKRGTVVVLPTGKIDGPTPTSLHFGGVGEHLGVPALLGAHRPPTSPDEPIWQ